MKLDKLKSVPNLIKQMFKPDWKRIVFLIILFLVLPQKISNDFTFFGGVYLIKYLLETYQPALDVFTFAAILLASYAIISITIWVYDKKINKFIVTEGEEEVYVPEKEEPKPGEETKEEQKEENKS